MSKEQLWKALHTPVFGRYDCSTCIYFKEKTKILRSVACRRCGQLTPDAYNWHHPDQHWEWDGVTYE